MSFITRPAAKLNTEYDLQGRLGVFTLSDLFQMLSFSNKSGVLTLIQGWNTRTITFENGRISYVAAGSRLPTMRDLLVRHGKIRRADLEHLSSDGIRSDEEVVRHLKSIGVIDESDIERCREQLLEISIFTLFLWRNCQFTFKSGEVIKEGGVEVSVDSMHLIIEGTRRVDEWIEISPVVPAGGFATIWQPRKRCRSASSHGTMEGYARIARSKSCSRFRSGGPIRTMAFPAVFQKQS
jgi:hypothetical protein